MYIVDPAEQIQLIKEMMQLRKDMKTYEVVYHHSYTDQIWKSFFPLASEGELGPKLLRHDPPPEDLKELISICLMEEVPQNAIGLGIEYSVKAEKWPEIFRLLEAERSSWNSRQLRLFLKHLKPEKFPQHLERVQNGRDLEGIYTHPEKDLKELLWRARKLKLRSWFF